MAFVVRSAHINEVTVGDVIERPSTKHPGKTIALQVKSLKYKSVRGEPMKFICSGPGWDHRGPIPEDTWTFVDGDMVLKRYAV